MANYSNFGIRRHQAKATVTEVYSDSELVVFMLLIIFGTRILTVHACIVATPLQPDLHYRSSE